MATSQPLPLEGLASAMDSVDVFFINMDPKNMVPPPSDSDSDDNPPQSVAKELDQEVKPTKPWSRQSWGRSHAWSGLPRHHQYSSPQLKDQLIKDDEKTTPEINQPTSVHPTPSLPSRETKPGQDDNKVISIDKIKNNKPRLLEREDNSGETGSSSPPTSTLKEKFPTIPPHLLQMLNSGGGIPKSIPLTINLDLSHLDDQVSFLDHQLPAHIAETFLPDPSLLLSATRDINLPPASPRNSLGYSAYSHTGLAPRDFLPDRVTNATFLFANPIINYSPQDPNEPTQLRILDFPTEQSNLEYNLQTTRTESTYRIINGATEDDLWMALNPIGGLDSSLVHVSCHTSHREIFLSSRENPATAFPCHVNRFDSRYLKRPPTEPTKVKLVVLNCCQGEDMAKWLLRADRFNIPVVIASKLNVPDYIAVAFFKVFYQMLYRQCTIEEAFQQADRGMLEDYFKPHYNNKSDFQVAIFQQQKTPSIPLLPHKINLGYSLPPIGRQVGLSQILNSCMNSMSNDCLRSILFHNPVLGDAERVGQKKRWRGKKTSAKFLIHYLTQHPRYGVGAVCNIKLQPHHTQEQAEEMIQSAITLGMEQTKGHQIDKFVSSSMLDQSQKTIIYISGIDVETEGNPHSEALIPFLEQYQNDCRLTFIMTSYNDFIQGRSLDVDSILPARVLTKSGKIQCFWDRCRYKLQYNPVDSDKKYLTKLWKKALEEGRTTEELPDILNREDDFKTALSFLTMFNDDDDGFYELYQRVNYYKEHKLAEVEAWVVPPIPKSPPRSPTHRPQSGDGSLIISTPPLLSSSSSTNPPPLSTGAVSL